MSTLAENKRLVERYFDALDRFELQLQADGRSEHTVHQYLRHVRLLAAWLADQGHSGDDRADKGGDLHEGTDPVRAHLPAEEGG